MALVFSGCAIQKPIPLSPDFYDKQGKKVGILVTEAPKAATSYTGSIGLLDYAIIAGVNSGLDKYLETLSFPEYEEFTKSLKAPLEKKGFQVVMIEKKLTKKERESLKQPQEGVSKTISQSIRKNMVLII